MTMRTAWLVIVLSWGCFAASFAVAQNAIELNGTAVVADGDGAPKPQGGVEVFVSSGKVALQDRDTDDKGRFTLTLPDRNKTYSVRFYHLGYLPHSIEIIKPKPGNDVPEVVLRPTNALRSPYAIADQIRVLLKLRSRADLAESEKDHLDRVIGILKIKSRFASEEKRTENFPFSDLRWETRSSFGKPQQPGDVIFRSDGVELLNQKLRLCFSCTDEGTSWGSEVLPEQAKPFGNGKYRINLASSLKGFPPGICFSVLFYGRGQKSGPGGPFVRLLTTSDKDAIACDVLASTGGPNPIEKNQSIDPSGPLAIEIDWQPKHLTFLVQQRTLRRVESPKGVDTNKIKRPKSELPKDEPLVTLFDWKCSEGELPSVDKQVVRIQFWGEDSVKEVTRKNREIITEYVDVESIQLPTNR